MPYIKQSLRDRYDKPLNKMPVITSKGALEYCVFKLFLNYMSDITYNYANLHNAIYAIIHAGEEAKRRFLDKKEDIALGKNGDIFIDETDFVNETLIRDREKI